MTTLNTDLLVVGGGLGGVAAALAALKLGRRVILTEETDWIGGQLTAQAVPPDENPWIESFGCTASWRRFRDGVRAYYGRNYPLSRTALDAPFLNPGEALVSRLCHEPRVALAVLEEMLAPWRSSGRLTVLTRHLPTAVDMDGDRVRAVALVSRLTGRETVVEAPYVLDATDLGDLLPLAGVEHVIGAEGRDETGELHAAEIANPMDQQAISWCFALDYLPDEDHTIERPTTYDFWRAYQADFWPGPQLGWQDVRPDTLEARTRRIFQGDGFFAGRDGSDFWHYRRILSKRLMADPAFTSDITLVNWPATDYWLKPLVGVDDATRAEALAGARQLALSMLYWMQTESPRHDGGIGYRGLRLRRDVVDTEDGLAKAVYVRESRRIRAVTTVLEQHVGVAARPGATAAADFPDSVGIGAYRIDLHPSTSGRNYVDVASYPFQIPLGALLPVRVDNLLPACKNIGTTHITNGCYRLHPVEWNIGEAAGALAAYCLEHGTPPHQVRADADHLAAFQQVLAARLRIPLAWPRVGAL